MTASSLASGGEPLGSGQGVGGWECERRFLLGPGDLRALLAKLSSYLKAQVYDAQHPVLYNRTTYFDTVDRRFLRSFQGRTARRVRLREYAWARGLSDEPRLTGERCLEYKTSSAGYRRKLRWAVPDGADCIDAMGGNDRAMGALVRMLGSGCLRPCLTTFYRRTHLTDAAGIVRVTLDHDLAFYAPVLLGRGGQRARPATPLHFCPQTNVVEVKYLGVPPGWLQRALADLRETSELSKFHWGMRSLTGWASAHAA